RPDRPSDSAQDRDAFLTDGSTKTLPSVFVSEVMKTFIPRPSHHDGRGILSSRMSGGIARLYERPRIVTGLHRSGDAARPARAYTQRRTLRRQVRLPGPRRGERCD